MLEFLDGKKTHIAVIGAIVAALVDFSNGGTDLGQLVNQIFLALGLSALRVGVAKK